MPNFISEDQIERALVQKLQHQHGQKMNGEIIDYYNVFRNMRKALKDYAQGQDGQENMPVREKSQLFKLLDEAIARG